MSQDNIVQVEDLVKLYPGVILALAGINFTVGRSEFFGFLGPNGAGKSTTIKIPVSYTHLTLPTTPYV